MKLSRIGAAALCAAPVSYTHLDVYKRQEHYQKLAEELAEYRSRHSGANVLFEYYEVLARLLEQKAELGIRIHDLSLIHIFRGI